MLTGILQNTIDNYPFSERDITWYDGLEKLTDQSLEKGKTFADVNQPDKLYDGVAIVFNKTYTITLGRCPVPELPYLTYDAASEYKDEAKDDNGGQSTITSFRGSGRDTVSDEDKADLISKVVTEADVCPRLLKKLREFILKHDDTIAAQKYKGDTDGRNSSMVNAGAYRQCKRDYGATQDLNDVIKMLEEVRKSYGVSLEDFKNAIKSTIEWYATEVHTGVAKHNNDSGNPIMNGVYWTVGQYILLAYLCHTETQLRHIAMIMHRSKSATVSACCVNTNRNYAYYSVPSARYDTPDIDILNHYSVPTISNYRSVPFDYDVNDYIRRNILSRVVSIVMPNRS